MPYRFLHDLRGRVVQLAGDPAWKPWRGSLVYTNHRGCTGRLRVELFASEVPSHRLQDYLLATNPRKASMCPRYRSKLSARSPIRTTRHQYCCTDRVMFRADHCTLPVYVG